MFWNPAEANFLDGKGQFCQMLLKNWEVEAWLTSAANEHVIGDLHKRWSGTLMVIGVF